MISLVHERPEGYFLILNVCDTWLNKEQTSFMISLVHERPEGYFHLLSLCDARIKQRVDKFKYLTCP